MTRDKSSENTATVMGPEDIARVLAAPEMLKPIVIAGSKSSDSGLVEVRVTLRIEGFAVIVMARRSKKWRRYLPEDGNVVFDAEPGFATVRLSPIKPAPELDAEAKKYGVAFFVHEGHFVPLPNPSLAIVSEAMLDSFGPNLKDCWLDPVNSPKRSKIVFIGGPPRSGTTLLQGLLNSDPESGAFLPEAVPIQALCEAANVCLRSADKFPGAYFADRPAVHRYFGEAIERLIEQTPLGPSGYTILKQPALTPHFPLLANLLPEAKFILLLRDPRAIAASLRQWGARSLAAGRPHQFAKADSAELADYINSFALPILKTRLEATRFRLLRYEDLVADPAATLRQLAAFLGRDENVYDPNTDWQSRDRFGLTSPDGPVADSVTEQYGKPPSRERTDSFRSDLPADELAAIERGCAILLTMFGYE